MTAEESKAKGATLREVDAMRSGRLLDFLVGELVHGKVWARGVYDRNAGAQVRVLVEPEEMEESGMVPADGTESIHPYMICRSPNEYWIWEPEWSTSTRCAVMLLEEQKLALLPLAGGGWLAVDPKRLQLDGLSADAAVGETIAEAVSKAAVKRVLAREGQGGDEVPSVRSEGKQGTNAAIPILRQESI